MTLKKRRKSVFFCVFNEQLQYKSFFVMLNLFQHLNQIIIALRCMQASNLF